MFLDNSKTSRNPERIIAKIQKTQKPVRMRGIFRKWNNPEIRQAAARQLQPVDTAEMLNIMYKAEREEVLSFYTDISELKELSRFCRGEVKSSVDWRIRELYRELLSESPEQEWLNKVICNESDMTIRKEAAEKLTDQKQLADCMIRESAKPDSELLVCLAKQAEDSGSLLKDPDIMKLPPRQFSAVRSALTCKGQHKYSDEHPGVIVTETKYHPPRLEYGTVQRCRVCGRRRRPAYQPQDIPSLANTPPILKEEIQAYQKLQKQSDRELRDLILDAGANKYLRMAAAEKIEDVPMILDILRTGLQGYNWKDKYTPEETLIWQLQEGPEGGLFESVAKDPGYDIKIREEIIARIWDMETLERLSEFPELSAACTKQRQEATCINGHQWELEREELRMYDENDWGSIRWRIRHYRCARCGATMEGPREQC